MRIQTSNFLFSQVPTAELSQSTGIFPTARARLSSLRNLGAKKIGALKLKLTENKFFAEKYKDKFVTPSVPDKIPQPLTVPDGPYFIIQTLDDSNLLSALYSTSNLLSVIYFIIISYALLIYICKLSGKF